MASWVQSVKHYFSGRDDKPLVGGKVYTYQAGTDVPKAAYKDAGFTVQHTNPVILDAQGQVDMRLNGLYKIVLKDANDVPIWSVDNVNGAGFIVSSPAGYVDYGYVE